MASRSVVVAGTLALLLAVGACMSAVTGSAARPSTRDGSASVSVLPGTGGRISVPSAVRLPSHAPTATAAVTSTRSSPEGSTGAQSASTPLRVLTADERSELQAQLAVAAKSLTSVAGVLRAGPTAAVSEEDDTVFETFSNASLSAAKIDSYAVVRGETRHVQLVEVSGYGYIADQTTSAKIPTSKTWVRVDPESSDLVEQQLTQSFQIGLGGFDVSNCAPFVAAADSAMASVSGNGQGVELTVRLGRMAAAATGLQRAHWQLFSDLYGPNVQARLSLHVDASGHCTRLKMGASFGFSDLTLSYGGRVSIGPPPASDTYTG